MEQPREAARSNLARVNKKAVAVLSLGHFINDAYSSTIYPLLPLLAAHLHLTGLQVFFLVPVLSITSAFMQPVYGFIADRHSRRMFAVLGPAVTGSFVSLMGVAPTYWVLVALLLCAGIGVGAFHPQAVSLAAKASGDRRRLGVSLFSSAGTFGFSLGPLIMALIVGATGLSHTTHTIMFGVIVSLLLYLYCPGLGEVLPVSRGLTSGLSALRRTLKEVRGPLAILFTITLSRSALYLLMSTYMPFILKDEGYSVEATGGVLTAFMLAGAMGSFAGGAVAGWIGERALCVLSGVLTTVFLAAAFFAHGSLSVALLTVGAFALMTVIPVNISQAQELAPSQTSTVSALMMGFAWGVGSLAAPGISPLTASIGFRAALMIVAVFPLLGGLLALALPPEKRSALKSLEEVTLAATPSGD